MMAPVMIREFPTALHSLLFKGRRPERHKDKMQHSGRGVPVFPIGGSSEEFIEGSSVWSKAANRTVKNESPIGATRCL